MSRRFWFALLLAACGEFPEPPGPCVDDEACGEGWRCVGGGCVRATDGQVADGAIDLDGAPPDGAPPDVGAPDARGPDAARDGAAGDACPDAGAERCNGADDDCDGETDEGLAVGEPCAAGFGLCQRPGRIVCVPAGEATCDAQAADLARAETCDGVDEDCDGRVDEDFDVGEACHDGEGACRRAGRLVCAGDRSTAVCDARRGAPERERCNGADDDCDGRNDEGFGVGDACVVGRGACERPGIVACDAVGAEAECTGAAGTPLDEACNDADDDCDGLVDEDFVDLGDACTNGLGVCARSGRIRCAAAGGTTCAAAPGPAGEERCNLLDDDCDGRADEDFEVGAPCTLESAVVPGCRATGAWRCAEGGGRACDAQVGPDAPEVCDGADNDCDRRVDEGFELLTDSRHCGACGAACGPFPAADAVCEGGQCFVGRCRDFFHDQDPLRDGCEAELPGRVLHVDARADGIDADGSELRPFRDLPEALRAAREGDIVELEPGRYTGRVEVAQHRLTVRGTRRDLTIVDGGLAIRGDYARVESLTVDAGGDEIGVDLLCGRGCAVRGNVVTNVGDPAVAGGARAGIHISTGADHVVEDNEVLLVRGADGVPVAPFDRCKAGAGGLAVGILLDSGATGSRVIGNTVSNVAGGHGGADLRESPQPCVAWNGATAGRAYGISLSDQAERCVVAGNRILDIRGGDGGDGARDGNGGTGGLAAGIRLVGANNRLFANTILRVTGGRGGAGGDGTNPIDGSTSAITGRDGASAVGFGVLFDPVQPGGPSTFTVATPALDNFVADTNTVDGDPIVYLFEESCRDVRGLRLEAPSNPTNLGKIALVGCRDVTVADNRVSHVVGLAGEASLVSPFEASPGHLAAGIYVLDGARLTLRGNTVADVEGGHGGGAPLGGDFSGFQTSGSGGGGAAGILLRRSTGVRVEGNVIGDVRGGRGGTGGALGGPGGRGGEAAGLRLVAATGNHLIDNEIADLAGGAGGPGGRGINPFADDVAIGADGPDGTFYGVFLDEATSLANTVTRSNRLNAEPIVYVHGEPDVRIENLVLTGRWMPTNVGKIAIVDSPGALVRNNRLREVRGVAGGTGMIGTIGLPGGVARGVFVLRSDGTRIEGNDVAEVHGGRGGNGGIGPLVGEGGTGGDAVGIEVRSSSNVALEGNVVHFVRGAPGGPGGTAITNVYASGPQGGGGDAAGIRVYDGGRADSLRDLVYEVTAHDAAFGLLFQRDPRPIGDALFATATNTTVRNVLGGTGRAGGIAAGDRVDLAIDCGIVANGGDIGVQALSGVGYFGVDAGGQGSVSIAFSNVFSSTLRSFERVREGAGLLEANPRFAAPAQGDFRLLPDSPSIDAGNPVARCDREPAPSVPPCRIDQGHFGNTPQAHSR